MTTTQIFNFLVNRLKFIDEMRVSEKLKLILVRKFLLKNGATNCPSFESFKISGVSISASLLNNEITISVRA